MQHLLDMLHQAEEFENQGRVDLALPLLDTFLSVFIDAPDTLRARALLIRGRINYRLKNHGGALRDLRSALNIDPSLAQQINETMIADK